MKSTPLELARGLDWMGAGFLGASLLHAWGGSAAVLVGAMVVLAVPFLVVRPTVISMAWLTVSSGLVFGVVRTFHEVPGPEALGNLEGVWGVVPIYGLLRAVQLVRAQ